MLAPSTIPMQRIITPISEEVKREGSKHVSPVEYIPIKFPEVAKSETALEPMQNREERIRSKSESAKPDHQSQSTSTSRTGSSDAYVEPYLNGPGFEELVRFESPPPADELIAQRKNESRYRLTLQHHFHPSRTYNMESFLKYGADISFQSDSLFGTRRPSTLAPSVTSLDPVDALSLFSMLSTLPRPPMVEQAGCQTCTAMGA